MQMKQGRWKITWVSDELNERAAEMIIADLEESRVKIFDAAGNLVDEISKAGFDKNTMKNSEYRLMAKSAFIFNYLAIHTSYWKIKEIKVVSK